MALILRDYLALEKNAFMDDLRPKYILPTLMADNTITDEEQRRILKESSPGSQVKVLFDIMQKKSGDVFNSFERALCKEDAYPWLMEKIQHRIWGDHLNENVENQLAMGSVPYPPNHVLIRKKDLIKIRNNLIKAAEKRRWWICLHGMIGCGKSVLASEAVRNNYLFNTYFSGGVYWIAVGNLKGDSALLHIMDYLCDKLEIEKQSHIADSSFMDLRLCVKKTSDYIKKHINQRKNSDILIILDDVWDANVLVAFDVGRPIIVTTQVTNIMESYMSYCDLFNCGSGLTFSESKQLLAKHVKYDEDQLPVIVDEICYKCKGSPLLLSRIGVKMARYGIEVERWKSLKDKLDHGMTVPLERHRYTSGDLKSELKTIIKLCLELIEDGGEYFLDFAVFREDEKIPAEVLEVFWNKSSGEVEDIMFELQEKSLVMTEADCYSIHDLYLEILKDDCEDEKKLHKKLVTRYLDLCRNEDGSFDYGRLPNDGYIHYFIGYHLYKAKEDEKLQNIYFDLNFIQNKVHFASPGDLLTDYDEYEYCFENVKAELNDYKAFVRRNASVFCQKDSDVIQYALLEPSESAVHKTAREFVSKSKSRTYFEWCNQEGNQACPYNLNTKSYSTEVKHAVFSPDGSLVAAVGEKVTILSSSSYEELETLTGHTEQINCCAFNCKGLRLATASDDKTVKIFETESLLMRR